MFYQFFNYHFSYYLIKINKKLTNISVSFFIGLFIINLFILSFALIYKIHFLLILSLLPFTVLYILLVKNNMEKLKRIFSNHNLMTDIFLFGFFFCFLYLYLNAELYEVRFLSPFNGALIVLLSFGLLFILNNTATKSLKAPTKFFHYPFFYVIENFLILNFLIFSSLLPIFFDYIYLFFMMLIGLNIFIRLLLIYIYKKSKASSS
ncbi:hypothetical protein ABSA28_00602 [Candidatus Hepatincolaceae symbiont of Richtersius coronifer]